MSDQTVDTPAITDASEFGEAWGDNISEERQRELEAILAAWDAETDHGDRKGPFAQVQLTGADVFYLAARALVGTTPLPRLKAGAIADLNAARVSLRDPKQRYFLDLSALRLEGSDLTGAYLTGANLRKAQLADTNLRDAKLEHSELTGMQLAHAHLWGAHLQGANLSLAELQGAALIGANLQGADLTYAQLQDASLVGAKLQGAKLIGAQLEHASLGGATLNEATKWVDREVSRKYRGSIEVVGFPTWRARAGGKPMPLTLSEEDRKALERTQAHSPNVRHWRRYQAVLLRAAGVPVMEVARDLGCSEASVSNWTAAWRTAGLVGVAESRHPGAARRLDGAAEEALDALVREGDPQAYGYAAANWTAPLLRTELATRGWPAAERTIRRTLHRLGWRWKRPKFVLGRPDPAYAEKKSRRTASGSHDGGGR